MNMDQSRYKQKIHEIRNKKLKWNKKKKINLNKDTLKNKLIKDPNKMVWVHFKNEWRHKPKYSFQYESKTKTSKKGTEIGTGADNEGYNTEGRTCKECAG